ncbi:MAG: 50S ribosomal protein L21 [Firmicutes bacterium]|nr:50S ribosomal protein L21 [Bacillota bacterium]
MIEIGSKQFKASIGDIFDVDFLNANVGDTLEFKVLFKSESSIFSTAVTTAKAEVLAHGKDKKITVFKYKPKKNIRKKQGHRQHITKIKIISF